ASGLSETDWFEGRMRVDAGQFEAGERLLSRFLEANPGHTGALQARARAHWGQRAPGAAAKDYQQAIDHSESPAPALYRALVVPQVAMGRGGHAAAAKTVNAALERFPVEVSLLGLGVELAVIRGDVETGAGFLDRLPSPVAELPQWRFRSALLACVRGHRQQAAEQFRALGESTTPAPRSTTWKAPPGTLAVLAAQPSPSACQAAALQSLATREP
ncbi:MAG: hypothetical protein HKN58_01780, partial [Xanthomonadales bacterium]|nr:hypothetical protein [Xanthomonadales bacterium]